MFLCILYVLQVVAKAIADGVIDAKLDHNNKEMISKDISDVYNTEEPHNTLHRRIRFCLDLHNEAVKVVQYDDVFMIGTAIPGCRDTCQEDSS